MSDGEVPVPHPLTPVFLTFTNSCKLPTDFTALNPGLRLVRDHPFPPGKRHRNCFCIQTDWAVASLSFQTCQSTPNPEDFFPCSTWLSLVHMASLVPVKQWPVAQTNICEGSENRTCPTKHIWISNARSSLLLGWIFHSGILWARWEQREHLFVCLITGVGFFPSCPCWPSSVPN